MSADATLERLTSVFLEAGVTFADLPHEFLNTLIQDAIVKRTANGELPALAAYLTGRTRADEHLGPWL